MKHVLLAIILFLAPMQVHAQGECLLQKWGTGFASYEQDGDAIAYELNADGTPWSIQGYGYHANAALICETCSNRDASWGLVHFNDNWSHQVSVPARPILFPPRDEAENRHENQSLDEARITNANERAQRRYERLYYPWITLHGDELTAILLDDSAYINDFNGYAVVFAISDPSAKGMPETVDGLIAFELTDGCAYFSGTVALPLEAPAEQLEQFLRSLLINRVQSGQMESR